MPSTRLRHLPEDLAIQRAAAIPATNTIAVVATTVLNEIHKGDR